MGGPGGGDHLKPVIAPDAVIDMHHQVTRAERLRLGQEIFGPAAFLRRADQPVTQNILFGNHRQIRGFEPMFQRPDRQVQPAFTDPVGAF